MRFSKKIFQKIISIFLVFVFIFSLAVFSGVSPVYSQQVEISAKVLEEVGKETVKEVAKETARADAEAKKIAADKKLWEARKKAIAVVVSNALKVFLGSMAQKAAEYVASGMTGQESSIVTDPFENVLSDAGDAAMGDAIAGLGKEIGLGNVCGGPWAINLMFGLSALSSKGGAKVTKPKCTFSSLSQGWDITDPEILSKFQVGFTTGSEANDIFMATKKVSEALNEKVDSQLVKGITHSVAKAAGGFKDVVDNVTKYVKTPGTLLQEHVGKSVIGMIGDNASTIFADPVYDALNIFGSTLMQQVSNFYLYNGLFNMSDLAKKDTDPVGTALNRAIKSIKTGATGQSTGSRAAASANFSSKINMASVFIVPTSFDFVQELMTCPDDLRDSSVYNCSLPSFLKTALDKKEGEFYTLQEAMDQKLVMPEIVFAYKDPGNRIEPNIVEGLPFSGIVKLRRARIVPIGWEIAGRLIRENSELKTLGDLMNEFDDRGEDGICEPWVDSDDSPYCNLVDPQWLLKAPVYNCRGIGYGQLISSSGTRPEYCTDIQDCVVEDDNGRCQAFGYCTREKNTWKLKGDKCEAEFDSCQSFTKTSEGGNYSYLKNSVDGEGCNSNNAGCNWYSLNKADDKWLKPGETSAKTRYYNANIKNYPCSEESEGCTHFIRFADYRTASSIEEEHSKIVAGEASYNDYIFHDLYIKIDPNIKKDENPLFCARDYVGCEEFKPTNGDTSVTSVISDLDRCPKDCNGYDSYIQEPTYFEMRKYGVDFIPNTGNQCDAANEGCEQFTNLDIPERQGENIENYKQLRQCEPYGINSKTYFFWEGTDTGHQLNRVSLVKGLPLTYKYKAVILGEEKEFTVQEALDSTPPKYIKGYSTPELCNKHIFDSKENPDCFELFDELGGRWYRSLSMTSSSPNPEFYPGGNIPFEEACHNYRKTLSGELVCSTGTCNPSDGISTCACTLGNQTCQVEPGDDSCAIGDSSCVETGGQWKGGECLYQSIPEENILCSLVGCKQYKGSTSRNERKVITDTFEGETDIRWHLKDGISSPVKSPVSLLFGGHSAKFNENLYYNLGEQCVLQGECKVKEGCKCVTDSGNVCNVERDKTACNAEFVSKDRSYVATFLLRNATTIPTQTIVKFVSSAGIEQVIGTYRTITSDWQDVVVGPIVFEREVQDDERLLIEVLSDDNNKYDVYVDNFTLREERDSYYLIENSWNTPSFCETDPPLRGGSAQTSMLGCKEYSDRFGGTEYLKSFRKLCPSNMIGCEALVNTYNSEEVGQRIYPDGAPADSQVIVPADAVDYIINDQKNYCSKDVKGCAKTALPNLGYNLTTKEHEALSCTLDSACTNAEGCSCSDTSGVLGVSCIVEKGAVSCEQWDEEFYLDDPDKYDETLCGSDTLWCEEYSSESTLFYFKDPRDKYCVYTKVPDQIEAEYAWYRAGDELNQANKNPAQCTCEYKSALTIEERTCTTAVACNSVSGCDCSITNKYEKNPQTCIVAQGSSSCLTNDLKAWFEKGNGILNPSKCLGLNPVVDNIWANTCPDSQNLCTSFMEPSGCTYRKGTCFMPTEEKDGVVLPIKCDSGAGTLWNSGLSWPDDDVGGCACNNGQTECNVRDGEYSCTSEPDWYQKREDGRDLYKKDGSSLVTPQEKINIDYNILAPTSTIPTGNIYETDKVCPKYYYINDDRIDKTSCNGMVDWLNECVMFNDTSKSNLTFTSWDQASGIDTTSGVSNIEPCNEDGNLLDSPRCDSNVLLSVVRDRTCGEWLQCNTSLRRWSPSARRFTDVCFNVGKCEESNESVPSQCNVWSKPDLTPEVLSQEVYQSRYKSPNGKDMVNWHTMEYSGYSIFDLYGVESASQRDYSKVDGSQSKLSDYKLSYLKKALWNEECNNSASCGSPADGTNLKYVCARQAGEQNSWCEAQCETDNDCEIAYTNTFSKIDDLKVGSNNPVCKVSVQGSTRTGKCYVDVGLDNKGQVVEKECRAYPEADSPIPYNGEIITYTDSLLPDKIQNLGYKDINGNDATLTVNYSEYGMQSWKDPEYEGVQVGFKDNKAVDCSYQKVVYAGSETHYYNENPPIDYPIVDKLYERSGTRDKPESSSVLEISENSLYLGWKGYCLEYDKNIKINAEPQDRACITWWPVDRISGEVDQGEMSPDSIWQAPIGGMHYCIGVDAKEIRMTMAPHRGTRQTPEDSNNEPGVQPDYYAFAIGSTKEDGRTRYSVGLKPNEPYLNVYDGLNFMELGFLSCNQWVQIQQSESLIHKVVENKAYTTKIRAMPGLYTKYWEGVPVKSGFKKSDGSDLIYFFNYQDLTDMSDIVKTNYPVPDDFKEGQEKNKVSLKNYGASCFVTNGCNNASPIFADVKSIASLNKNINIPVGGSWYPRPGVSAAPECYRNNIGVWGTQPISIPIISGLIGGRSKVTTVAEESVGIGPFTTVCDPEQPHDKVLQEVSGSVGFYGGAPYNGIDPLKQLFGKVYAKYDVDGNSVPFSGWNFSGESPIIKPSIYSEGLHKEINMNGNIAVNGKYEGKIESKKFLMASMSFYAYNANGEQMPIREVRVSWGDGTQDIIMDGYFKNRKPKCERYCAGSVADCDEKGCGGYKSGLNSNNLSTNAVACSYNYQCGKDTSHPGNQCVPYNFGDSVEGCVEDTDDEIAAFTFTHVYNCADNNDDNYDPDQLACQFQPSVYIRDNWGEFKTGIYKGTILVSP